MNASGELFVTRLLANVLDRIDIESWVSSRFVGSEEGFSGDGRVATDGVSNGPTNLALDSNQNIFFSDGDRIRRIDSQSQLLSSIADGVGTLGVDIDANDDVFYSDHFTVSRFLRLPSGHCRNIDPGGRSVARRWSARVVG